MNDSAELLQFIFKNAEMGRMSIPKMLEKASGEELSETLSQQLEEYKQICHDAETTALDRYSVKLTGLDSGEKMMTEFMMKFKTIGKPADSHIADMILKGSSTGLRDISEQIAKYQGADEEVLRLAEKLKKTEERNLSEMKQFLTSV